MAADPRAGAWSPGLRVAVGSGVLYVVLALVAGGSLPFVERHMFRFAVMEGPVALPLLRVDGVDADCAALQAISGLSPDQVDVEHRGYQSSVEHKFAELRDCLAARQAPAGAAPGPLRVELGLIILQHVNGELQVRERIDAVGAAEARP
jgi:hypothetical protein